MTGEGGGSLKTKSQEGKIINLGPILCPSHLRNINSRFDCHIYLERKIL